MCDYNWKWNGACPTEHLKKQPVSKEGWDKEFLGVFVVDDPVILDGSTEKKESKRKEAYNRLKKAVDKRRYNGGPVIYITSKVHGC